MEAAILKNAENNKIKTLILFLKLMHTHTHLIHVVFVCYEINHFVGFFFPLLLGIIGKQATISSVRE